MALELVNVHEDEVRGGAILRRSVREHEDFGTDVFASLIQPIASRAFTRGARSRIFSTTTQIVGKCAIIMQFAAVAADLVTSYRSPAATSRGRVGFHPASPARVQPRLPSPGAAASRISRRQIVPHSYRTGRVVAQTFRVETDFRFRCGFEHVTYSLNNASVFCATTALETAFTSRRPETGVLKSGSR